MPKECSVSESIVAKKIDAHTALANKFDAIRTLNKQSTECWTVAQTKTTAACYKRAGNLPLPTTKQLLLTRYHDTMMCCDAAVQLQLHDKVQWEFKNERCNDCSEKMQRVFDGTNKI